MKFGKIEQTRYVSDDLKMECCHIVSSCNGDVQSVYNHIQNDVNQKGELMFVYFLKNWPVGFIKGCRNDLSNYAVTDLANLATTQVECLYVNSGSQGKGIGGSLLSAYADYEKAAGAQYLFLRATKNEKTLKFYRDIGLGVISREIIGQNYIMGRHL